MADCTDHESNCDCGWCAAERVLAKAEHYRHELSTVEVVLESLQNKFEQVTGENARYEDAMNEAILNKELAENQERLARAEIGKLTKIKDAAFLLMDNFRRGSEGHLQLEQALIEYGIEPLPTKDTLTARPDSDAYALTEQDSQCQHGRSIFSGNICHECQQLEKDSAGNRQ